MATSSNLQDLCYWNHSGGGRLAGSKDSKPICFPCYFSALCLAFSAVFFSDPCVLLATWGSFVDLENTEQSVYQPGTWIRVVGTTA